MGLKKLYRIVYNNGIIHFEKFLYTEDGDNIICSGTNKNTVKNYTIKKEDINKVKDKDYINTFFSSKSMAKNILTNLLRRRISYMMSFMDELNKLK
jgi:hypothetical protein